MLVGDVIHKIAESCTAKEYGDIRSMLDDYKPSPAKWELRLLLAYMYSNVSGAEFGYDNTIGWYYDE